MKATVLLCATAAALSVCAESVRSPDGRNELRLDVFVAEPCLGLV